MKIAFQTLMFILLLLGLWIFGPLVVLWSLNTLFFNDMNMAIEYTFINWLAMFSLGIFARGTVNFNNNTNT